MKQDFSQTALYFFTTLFRNHNSYDAWPEDAVAEEIRKIAKEIAPQVFADL